MGGARLRALSAVPPSTPPPRLFSHPRVTCSFRHRPPALRRGRRSLALSVRDAARRDCCGLRAPSGERGSAGRGRRGSPRSHAPWKSSFSRSAPGFPGWTASPTPLQVSEGRRAIAKATSTAGRRRLRGLAGSTHARGRRHAPRPRRQTPPALSARRTRRGAECHLPRAAASENHQSEEPTHRPGRAG